MLAEGRFQLQIDRLQLGIFRCYKHGAEITDAIFQAGGHSNPRLLRRIGYIWYGKP
jgi:hypothetical protein